MSPLTYLFWPNPGSAGYGSPTMLSLLIVAFLLIAGPIALRMWRKHLDDKVLLRLSRSWAGAALWFGIVLLVLVISRVESIQFVAMRVWLIVWGVALLLYAAWQVRVYQQRYYEVLPAQHIADPREKYLPKRRKR